MRTKDLNSLRWARDRVKQAVHRLGDANLVSRIGGPLYRLRARKRERELPLSEMRRIAVVRLDGLGDTLMFSPFLRELKRNAPRAEITLIVKPAVFPLVELCPYTTQIFTYDPLAPDKFGILRRHWRALKLSAAHFWGKGFDLLVLPRWEVYHDHEPFLGYFTGVKKRVGYSESVSPRKATANAGSDRLLTRVVHDTAIRHEVEYSLRMLEALGGTVAQDHLEVWLSAEDEAVAAGFFDRHGVRDQEPIVAICPGAAIGRRRWPIDRFVEVSRWLIQTYPVRLLLVGGKAESEIAAEFERQMGVPILSAQRENFSVRETAAILKRASLYFGNNTGPMHMAAASGVPVIELSCHPASAPPQSENSPVRFRAWRVPDWVIQPSLPTPPCTDHCPFDTAHCICGITVEMVKDVLRRYFDEEVGKISTASGRR